MTDLFADIDATIDSIGFPANFGRAGQDRVVNPQELVLEVSELTEEHVAAAHAHLAAGAPSLGTEMSLKSIRATHHRLAQVLALGMDETKAARLCNYDKSRVSQLKRDPAFAELMAYYSTNVEVEMMEFVSAAKELTLDFLGKLQQDLDETPEKFTPHLTLEAIKVLADRTGHAPVQKSIAVNVNADVGSRLNAAKERLRNVTNGRTDV